MNDPSPPRRAPAEDVADAQLVAQALQGERGAQEQLFFRHVGMVTGMIRRLHPATSDLDDLVQDTFLAAFRSLARLDRPQAFAAWVGSIAVRTTLKKLRRQRLAQRLGLVQREEVSWDEVLSPGCPPDLAIELRQLYRAVEQLPPAERVALLLRRVEGLSLEEIVAATGESLATVKRRIAAAEARLRAAEAGR